MRKALLAAGLIVAIAAPSAAFANCHQRRVTGAVAGGLGGGIIGAAAASAPWGFAAAGMGALLGHTIAASTCHSYDQHAYYRRYRHHYAYYPRHHYAYDHRRSAYYSGYDRPHYDSGYYHRDYYGGY
jgi:hypothetical protein